MSGFDAQQKKYYTTEINRSIPTRAQVDDATLSLALGDVDPEMPGPNSGNRRAKETASFLSTFGTTNNLAQRDSLCASYASPSPAMRDAAARTGCGWWYVPDSRGHSVGAYGTRRGPMNTQIDSQVGNGEWIWNLDDAARRESTKLTHKIKSCADIDFYKKQNPNIGWCATMGTAVVVDQYGRPAFPKAPGGYCPEDERIIMNSADCPIPEPPSATDPGSTQGNAGISWLCSQSSGGSLSPQCLKAVTEVYCSSNGTLAQALSNGYPSSSSNFNNANRYLVERGFELNPGLVNGGATTLNAALNSVSALRQLANSGEPSLSTGAAANMCYGYRFNPCDVRSDKTQPYDQHCIRTVALNMGYGQNGALLSKGGDFWNKMPMWKDVIATLAHWKQLADSGPDPTKQTEAIRMVYGISVKYPFKTCVISTLPNLQIWYDGTDPNGDGTTPADGSKIDTWVNKGGFSSFNAIAKSPATYSAARKALYFDRNIYSTGYTASPTSETIFIVFNTPPPTSTPYTAALMSGYTGARGFWVGYTDGAGSGRGAVGILSSDIHWNATTPAGSYAYGSNALTTGQINGGRSWVSLNGGPMGQFTGPTNFTGGTTTFIGQQYGAGHTYNFVGYAMEIVIYGTALTASQIQQVEGYLAWKWGLAQNLPAAHPFKKAAP